VGGWRKLGIDPSMFSNALCKETNEYLVRHLNCGKSMDHVIEKAVKSGLMKASV